MSSGPSLLRHPVVRRAGGRFFRSMHRIEDRLRGLDGADVASGPAEIEAAARARLERQSLGLGRQIEALVSAAYGVAGQPSWRWPAGVEVAEVSTDVGPFLIAAHDSTIRPELEQTGRWEPEEADLTRTLVDRGDLIVDVGAHCGYFSLLFAKAAPAATVLAVEAEPANFGMLCRNLDRNGAGNVVAVHAAAGEATGVTRFSRDPANTGDHRGFARTGFDGGEVLMLALDEVVPSTSTVGLVKIDTQGMDAAVIRGMQRTIERCMPIVIVEFWPPGIEEFGGDPVEVLAYYESFGYGVGVLEHESDDALPAAQVLELARSNRGNYVTLVLRPR